MTVTSPVITTSALKVCSTVSYSQVSLRLTVKVVLPPPTTNCMPSSGNLRVPLSTTDTRSLAMTPAVHLPAAMAAAALLLSSTVPSMHKLPLAIRTVLDADGLLPC